MNTPIPKNGVLKNGQAVNYVQQGRGAPVILVHGLAASLHDWDDLLPVLADNDYAGYALDILGHGESEKPKDKNDYTFVNLYQHFSAWIDLLGIQEPMILVGHSLGAGAVIRYALDFPDRVKALVLVNPFYDVRQLPPIMQFVFQRQLLNTALIDRTPYGLFRFVVELTSFNFYIGQRETHILPEHIRYQTALDYKRSASGVFNIPRTIPNLESSLSQLQQPTLLVWGARDQTLMVKSFPQLANQLPKLIASHVMPLCGHVPHQCHSAQFNALVMEFFEKVNHAPWQDSAVPAREAGS